MTGAAGERAQPSGGRHFLAALRCTLAGFRHAAATQVAVRQELAALIVFVPIALWLPVTAAERLLLVLSLLFLLVTELLNTAIEMTLDRISLEHHTLTGRAKDVGSAAVGVAVLMAALTWLVIAGPVALQWIRA